MAALDFPSAPSLNDEYTANGKTWYWDGEAWSAFFDLSVESPLAFDPELSYLSFDETELVVDGGTA